MSVRRRLLDGVLAGGFGQAVTLLIQLVSLPLFLHVWGSELYGEWLLLTAIPAYLAMSDAGFASVAANRMAMDVAQGRHDAALVVFQSTLLVLAVASAIAFGAGLVAVRILASHTGLEALNRAAPGQLTAIVLVLAAQVAVGFYGGLAAAGYRCEGRFARATMAANAVRLAEFAATVGALLALGTPLAIALAALATRLAGTFLIFGDLRRAADWIRPGLSHARMACVRGLLRPAFAFAAVPLGAAMLQQGMALVVGTVMGAPHLVVWSAVRTASRVLLQASSLLNAPLWPELSIAYGRGDLGLARRLHRMAVQLSLWLVTPPAFVLFAASSLIFRVWSHGQITVAPTLFAVNLLQVVVNLIWGTSSVVAAAVNRHEQNSLAFLAAASLSVAAAIPLTQHFGLLGTSIALLGTDVVMLPIAAGSALRLVADKPSEFIANVIRPPLHLMFAARA